MTLAPEQMLRIVNMIKVRHNYDISKEMVQDIVDIAVGTCVSCAKLRGQIIDQSINEDEIRSLQGQVYTEAELRGALEWIMSIRDPLANEQYDILADAVAELFKVRAERETLIADLKEARGLLVDAFETLKTPEKDELLAIINRETEKRITDIIEACATIADNSGYTTTDNEFARSIGHKIREFGKRLS